LYSLQRLERLFKGDEYVQASSMLLTDVLDYGIIV
jgi:hypothetical protein